MQAFVEFLIWGMIALTFAGFLARPLLRSDKPKKSEWKKPIEGQPSWDWKAAALSLIDMVLCGVVIAAFAIATLIGRPLFPHGAPIKHHERRPQAVRLAKEEKKPVAKRKRKTPDKTKA